MILRSELVIVIIAFFVRKLVAQYPSVPCPEIFRYDQSGEVVFGIVTIKNVDYGTTKLDIQLAQTKDTDLDSIGKISLNFDINDSLNYIQSGTAFSYRVDFGAKNEIPKVQSISVNGVKICSGPKALATDIIINLKHSVTVPAPSEPLQKTTNTKRTTSKPFATASTGLNQSSPQDQPKFLSFTFNPRNGPPLTTSSPTPTSTNINTIAQQQPVSPNEWTEINSVCGQENFNNNIKMLVVNGESVPRARFPWIVAIFKRNSEPISFQCGGSLITKRTVISAAHCFYSGFNLIKVEDILVSMGRHNITDSNDPNAVQSEVQKIILHPDYKLELDKIDADLAILQLKESVTFSVFIRPICMWDGLLDVSYIEGASGIIVGWGQDQNKNAFTITPRLAKAIVVSELTCIKSAPNFLHYTSNRTLCAGNRDGSGPCRGDSGSGLMIQYRNKWRLRGTVSRALSSENNSCNLEEYILYTDVAQFSQWIYENSVF